MIENTEEKEQNQNQEQSDARPKGVVADVSPKTVRAVVTEALPSTLFRVDVNGEEMLAYLSGKMRLHRIRILVGDSVEVLLDPYGGKGRITRRL